jgi:hypothetical protein
MKELLGLSLPHRRLVFLHSHELQRIETNTNTNRKKGVDPQDAAVLTLQNYMIEKPGGGGR